MPKQRKTKQIVNCKNLSVNRKISRKRFWSGLGVFQKDLKSTVARQLMFDDNIENTNLGETGAFWNTFSLQLWRQKNNANLKLSLVSQDRPLVTL